MIVVRSRLTAVPIDHLAELTEPTRIVCNNVPDSRRILLQFWVCHAKSISVRKGESIAGACSCDVGRWRGSGSCESHSLELCSVLYRSIIAMRWAATRWNSNSYGHHRPSNQHILSTVQRVLST